MDAVDTISNTSEGKECPPVPIKTYKWEDVKRARRKGAYPWTHLQKGPYDEDVDPEIFTMEHFRKCKSSSTLGSTKSESSGVVIQEINESDTERSEKEKFDDHDKENQSSNAQEAAAEVAADSSGDDDISQYLDKDGSEQNIHQQTEPGPTPGPSAESAERITPKDRPPRAKSEEPKRKRKLSIESSYSRISMKSLSRLGIVKRLREAKDKIKMPKFPSFSKLDKRSSKAASEKEKAKPAAAAEAKKATKHQKQEPVKDQKPVYIHIPLKLPPGETDEFSKYADEPLKSSSAPPTTATTEKEDSTEQGEQEPKNQNVHLIILSPPSDDEILEDDSIPETPSEKDKPMDKAGIDALKFLAKNVVDEFSPETKKELKVISEERSSSEEKESDSQSQGETPMEVVEVADKDVAADLVKDKDLTGKKLSKKERRKRALEAKEKEAKEQEASAQEAKKQETIAQDIKMQESTEVIDKEAINKEAKDKEIQEKEIKSKEVNDKEVQDKEVIEKELKELESKEKGANQQKAKEKEAEVQKAKDKEIKDKEVKGKEVKGQEIKGQEVKDQEIKDTDTKEKEANNEQPRKEDLVASKDEQIVTEETLLENITDDQKQQEMSKTAPKAAEDEQMMVDEEDGLQLNERAIALINEELAKENLPKLNEAELKSSLKAQEPSSSPVMKKKVSFKRKNKAEHDYEVIEAPKEEKLAQPAPLEASQSMSVDEEKTYLDEKIIKSASLEEDYNKWSKNLDHEYEPVNPPPEDTKFDTHVPAKNKTKTVTTTTTTVTKTKKASKATGGKKSPSPGPQYIRIPLHEDVVISSEGEDTDRNDQDDEGAQQLQDRIEAQYFKGTSSKKEPEVDDEGTSSKKETGKRAMLTQIEGQGKKLKEALSAQTGKIKTKIKGMKRPNISMPQKPKFDQAKIQRIKDCMPKMPDTCKFKMPEAMQTFGKKKPSASKHKQRQYSTESNAGGDSKMKIFDFSTYPRIFKGRKRDDGLGDYPESATVPRAAKNPKKHAKEAPKSDKPVYIRIPLHSEESMEQLEPSAAQARYNDDIDVDDAYQKENQEIHKTSPFSSKYIERWKHGTFHAQPKDNLDQHITTDLDNSDEHTRSQSSPEPRMLSTGSLGDVHGRGVIEEINEDEFFVRQKGISQDNIEVGEYLSSEIREAFKTPVNPLRQMQDDSYDREYELDISDQSVEEAPKRKPIKKPKRKRTPHVSQEKIAYDQESITTEPEEYPKVYPPGRPKRRSKKGAKKSEDSSVVPYQETIPVEKLPERQKQEQRQEQEQELELALKLEREHEHKDVQMYENEHMRGIEQPEIFISNAYQRDYYQKDIDDFMDDDLPQAPPRKQRSLKSLTASEHDSIIGEYNQDRDFTSQEIEAMRLEHEYIIPTPELEPPTRPRRSRTRSHSRLANEEEHQQQQHQQLHHEPEDEEDQISVARDFEEELGLVQEQPCVEAPCIQDLRDCMGYAIIDKNRQHEPPLPPPRFTEQPKTPPRRRRGKVKDDGSKFFTVPRQMGDSSGPVRPLRNYSTLTSSLSSKKKVSLQNLTDEEKENVDVCPYSEIPDEAEQSKKLQSGEVVQKMKDRPLPAPPRPPRKTRGGRALRDITNDDMESIISNIEKDIVEETETSTQTEPLPDDFECEEVVQEIRDKIITPTRSFDHEETVTHGSLLVQPMDGAQILPDHQLSRERIVPITRTDAHFYENEISEIPEEFLNLKSPEEEFEPDTKPVAHQQVQQQQQQQEHHQQYQQQPILASTEVETLKAQKLQVSDLDVDRLTVNELLANKIRVSEIDSGNIQVSEINSQGGNLVVSGIELPPSFFEELVHKLQSAQLLEQMQREEAEQKKTPTEPRFDVEHPERPPRISRSEDHEKPTDQQPEPEQYSEEAQSTFQPQETVQGVPERPPRSKPEQLPEESDGEYREEEDFPPPPELEPSFHMLLQESDVMIPINTEDLPPPRPPQPFGLSQEDFIFLPSQPPPSFFQLRDFLDDDIPAPPRRRRPQKHHQHHQHHQHHELAKESSSEEALPIQRRHRRSRTPEATIPELAGQLSRACFSETNRHFKRLIAYITNNVLDNADGKQDLHVTIVILLVLIAGLILLGFGDGTTVHHHHWEYFNPPKNL